MGDTEKGDILNRIKNINIARYHYNGETQTSPLRLGLIAEEAPVEVLSASGKGVDVYKLSTFILAGVQEQQKKLEDLEVRVARLEAAALSGAGSSSVTLQSILDSFKNLGLRFEAGFAYMKDLIVDTLTVGSKEKPAGITLYNKA